MLTLKVAWRNLFRNRTRTAITGSAIAFSYMLLLATFGVSDDSYLKMIEEAGRMLGGGVLVHQAGWWQRRSPKEFIAEPEQVMAQARSLPGVVEVNRRVAAVGLLSSARGNAGVELRGIDPAHEPGIERVRRHLVEGTFLDGKARSPLVIGAKTARRLDVGLGDRVVFTATGGDGELRRALFRVTGILGGGSSSVEEGPVYTTVEAAKRALGLGRGVTQIGLVLDPQAEPAQVKAALLERLGGAGNLEVLTWREAMPEMVQVIQVDKEQAYLIFLLVLLVVGFGIANTILMSVMERVRELGLIAALGVTPGGIVRLVVTETLVLGAVAMAFGLLGALAIHTALQPGIPAASLTGESFEVAGVVLEDYLLSSAIVLPRWIGGTLAVAAVVFLSSLYPAIRASRLDPVEAMRTYE